MEEIEVAMDLDFYKGRIDAEEVLEALGIDIAFRRNDQLMCHCPDWLGNHANGDANPSFGFNEEKLLYNCFVCGGGNLIQLTMNLLDTTDAGAEQFLLGYAGLEPQDTEDFVDKISKILHPYEETEVQPDYPAEALFQYRKIHPYLYERGLTREVIVEHEVGWDETHDGIVIPHWFMGVLKGWQMRHLQMDGDKYVCSVDSCNFKNEKKIPVPKYKNTSHFPKVNTLYAYDQTMRYVKREQLDWVIVVESPMTALYLKSIGFGNVMATFGSFNPEQGSLLWPFRKVYFWPDNDKAGVENTKKAISTLSRYVELWIVGYVPGAKADAADLEPDMIQQYLDEAMPAMIWGKLEV